MGCVFSSGDVDTDAASGDINPGASCMIGPGEHANVAGDIMQKKQREQQQQAGILMTANASASSASGRLRGQQQQNNIRQSFSFVNLLAHGRKVIQSKVNAIDVVPRTTATLTTIAVGANQLSLGGIKSQDASIESSHRRRKSANGRHHHQQQPGGARMMASGGGGGGDRANETHLYQASDFNLASLSSITTASDDKSSVSKKDSVRSDEVILFTSIQQLCARIIKGSIIQDTLDRTPRAGSARSAPDHRLVCVFLFGAQGSCKGELAFDLVQHSPLLRTISAINEPENRRVKNLSKNTDNINNNNNSNDNNDNITSNYNHNNCPLYHHIDVAGLIIANIDARIREYIQLQLQAIQNKQLEQEELKETDKNSQQYADESPDGSIGEQSETQLLDSLLDVNSYDELDRFRDPSIASDISTSPSIQFDLKRLANDDFALVTLSTKQRSILQLRLIKYSNCVSPKWIVGLIEAEVDRLEARVRQQSSPAGGGFEAPARERVYLINLVPNQLSLFKSCLYLHNQDLRLREFKYPVVALKFERRTNIRLMTKERAIGKKSSGDSSQGERKSAIKTITSIGLARKHHAPKSDEPPPTDSNGNSKGTTDHDHQDRDSSAMATIDLLSSGLNEKLGPKLSDTFVEQFKTMRRLYRARYNGLGEHDEGDENCDHRFSETIRVVGGEATRQFDHPSQHQLASPVWFADGTPSPPREAAAVALADSSAAEDTEAREAASRLKPLDRSLSSSMQNLLSLPETSASNQPRLSLSVSPTLAGTNPSPSCHQLSPNSLLVSSADTSLASSTALTTSGESLSSVGGGGGGGSSIGRHSSTASGDYDSIRRTIEIQLVDLRELNSHFQPSNLAPDERQEYQSKLQRWRHGNFRTNSIDQQRPPMALAYFSEPRRFSPLMHMGGQTDYNNRQEQQQGGSSQRRAHNQSSNYQLISSKVIDEQSSPRVRELLEVKRLHSRTLKLKSVADLGKLTKLIKKARRQLETDTKRWLAEAIIFGSYRLLSPADSLMTVGASANQKEAHAGALSKRSPSRIVYILPMDIHRLKLGQIQLPDEIETRLNEATNSSWLESTQKLTDQLKIDKSHVKSILKIDQPNRRRPLSASVGQSRRSSGDDGSINKKLDAHKQQQQLLLLDVGPADPIRPASSLAIDSTCCPQNTDQSRRPKHVQFRFNKQAIRQLPGQAGDQQQQQLLQRLDPRYHSPAALFAESSQQRIWINEDLFVSCSADEDKSLIELAAALIKIHLDSGGGASSRNKSSNPSAQ